MKKPVALALAGTALLAVLAWLLWPGGSDGAATAQAASARHTVHLRVEEPKTGLNAFDVEVTDPLGHPAEGLEVTVEPVMAQMGHALEPVTAPAKGPGRYHAAETLLPMSGQWEITVRLRDHTGTEELVFPLLVGN
ncbi:FixH family protein [Amycolatopsis sp. 195334CR]|uniref:FixH family protein n=1 Tax=Amycolatopsis sp. 195334CR TaxID=2814588 RepID=UPI001A902928|nr:FixH family protein [Amycolatopsis sp. 195334CR]MBN6035212.1 FixH family protein [Amycolatopsis sp. 195334CR]